MLVNSGQRRSSLGHDDTDLFELVLFAGQKRKVFADQTPFSLVKPLIIPGFNVKHDAGREGQQIAAYSQKSDGAV